jgi:hypothetical protein
VASPIVLDREEIGREDVGRDEIGRSGLSEDED